jgi:hypothetical protein
VGRPSGVAAVTLALAVLAGVNVAYAFAAGPDTTTRAVVLAYSAIGWAVLYYFWTGRNWARVLIMIQSVFLVLNALLASRVSHQLYLYMMALAAVGIFLLFYLNRPEIRSWFVSQTDSARRRTEDQKAGLRRAKQE